MLEPKIYEAAMDIWRGIAHLCLDTNRCIVRKTGETVDATRAVQHMLNLINKQGLDADGLERKNKETFGNWADRVWKRGQL